MKQLESVLVVANPVAGRGRASKRIQDLEGAFRAAGISYDLALTKELGQAASMAADGLRRGYTTIVAAGGDGTINEVINGMAETTPAGQPIGRLSVYPIGSGNDFAFSLGAARDAGTTARAIREQRVRRIDVGAVTLCGSSGQVHRFFHNSLGFGLEASVTVESNHIQKLSGGLLYLAAAFRAIRAYRMPRAEIDWRDEGGANRHMEQTITLMSIGNARRTGGAFYLTPAAKVDDGLFDVAVAGALSRIRILSLLPLALVGKHTGDSAVTMLRCSEIHARSEGPLPVHMDGEVIMTDAFEVNAVIDRARLEILV